MKHRPQWIAGLIAAVGVISVSVLVVSGQNGQPATTNVSSAEHAQAGPEERGTSAEGPDHNPANQSSAETPSPHPGLRSKTPSDPASPQPESTADRHSFGRFHRIRREGRFGGPRSESTTEAGSENDSGLISLAFKDMSMEQVAKFISEKTGKPVIPDQAIANKKITIVSTRKMTLTQALQTLREALRLSGVIMEDGEHVINLRPIQDAAQANLPILTANEPLTSVINPARIVRKVFKIEHYDPVKIKDAIVPMLPPYGGVIADAATNTLMVTDTVEGLRRVEQVIHTLDVPMAGAAVRTIFKLKNADAAWVASVIKLMISGDASAAGPGIVTGQNAGSNGRSSGNSDDRNRRRFRRSGESSGGPPTPPSSAANPAQSVVAIAGTKGPVLLVPEVARNWILAVAPLETMKRIEEWVTQLDKQANSIDPFQIYTIQYVDITQISEQISAAIEAAPNLSQSLRVVPFVGSRKLLVFGSNRGQELVQTLLKKLDVESANSLVMNVIPLTYADAAQVAQNIETLFSNQVVSYQSQWGTRYRQNESGNQVQVKVTADPRRNALTIVTDAKTMAQIEKLIHDEWDLPLDAKQVQPRVYVLQYADAVQMKDLLDSLFSEQQQSFSFSRFFFGGGGNNNDQNTPVGRLFGQFAFQALPDSNRLVVTTQNAANYEVIDQLVEQLDKPQTAGVPSIVELKHANAEDLAEQINAALAQPGTLASIVRSNQTLTTNADTSAIAQAINGSNSSGGGSSGNQNNQQDNNPNQMTFWWQRAQVNPNEQPTSNLIGKIRVVPIVRRNALMVLSPRAYREPIVAMIKTMDQPGSQVIIHAVIAESVHQDTTTLGMRIASDPAILSAADLADQSIGASTQTKFNQLAGEPFTLGSETLARGIFSSDINLNVLVQLLIRNYGLKVLTEPKLYTSDNEEAEFFDGSDVSVQVASEVTPQGGLNRSFVYVPIGTRLRILPHITNEGDVKLIINILLSSIAPGASSSGNPTFDRRETTTRITVHDGETIMLSGIMRQEQVRDVRKLPILGDIPLLGGLFRSTDKQTFNRELIIFITPQVVANTPEATNAAMKEPREILQRLKGQMPPSPSDQPIFKPGEEPQGVK